MLRVLLEGTPASFPVQAFNASAPVVWEAGAFAALDANGAATLYGSANATASVLGLIADRRNTTIGMSNATFLPSNPGAYGDESLFNQPGYGNSVFGQTGTVNNILPANTIPTTTLLRDETAQNPNVDSRYLTVYIMGGVFQTDQYDVSVATSLPGTPLFVNTASGLLTTATTASGQVAVQTKAVDGNGFVEFKLSIV